MKRVLFPHQLFHREYEKDLVLIEHPRFFSDYCFHKQKLVLHRASMKSFQEDREVKDYIEQDGDIERPFRENTRLSFYRPEDRKLREWIQEQAQKHETEITIEESPMFLTDMEENRKYFQENSYYHSNYYKRQRKRLNVLMEKGKPVGGKWSFDPENREKMPEDHKAPDIPEFSSEYVEEAKDYVEDNFPGNPGSLENFIYPVKREQALENLEDFLDKRLEKFGKYQDAFDKDLQYGYHSLLSPSLNIGLITPDEVVEKTLEKHKENRYPLNSLEGFLRQIIGWREFIRALYHLEPGMKEENFWGAENQLPREFYTGETDLPPIDRSIERVQENGYTHHIERLMVLGNVMLLLEIDPDEVHRWFMEMFIDSYDWVMTPNIYGMSQYSYTDMMTKPYISSSNYVQKMSNYPDGEWCRSWDGLYWQFIKKHREKISKIPRMGFMKSTLDRMNEDTIDQHKKEAEKFRDNLGI